MALLNRVIQRGMLCRSVSAPLVVNVQLRNSRNLPDADYHQSEEEKFKGLYKRQILTSADSHPTVKPSRRRFGIAACESGYVSEKVNTAMKAVLKRLLGAEGLIDYLKMPIQVTKKPPGKRAGGGKGKKAYKLTKVHSNMLMLEWDHHDRLKTEKYACRLQYLTPIRLKLVMNDLGRFDQLKEDINMGRDVSVEDFKQVKRDLDEKEKKSRFRPEGPITL